jgi:hypothetical protein
MSTSSCTAATSRMSQLPPSTQSTPHHRSSTADTNHMALSTRRARNVTNQQRARQPQHPRNGHNNYGRERGSPGVEYACTICWQDNHTTAKCSNNTNQAHIAHQVQVQVAAALAPFVTACPSVNPSAVDEHTAAPSRILLDSAASTTMAPDSRYHHSITRSSAMVTVANSSTTPATASVPDTLPNIPQSTKLGVLVVPGIQDTLLAASEVTMSSEILIQKDKVFTIPHGPQPSSDRTRPRGHQRNGVYDIMTATANTVRHWKASARAIWKAPHRSAQHVKSRTGRSSATTKQTLPRHYCQLENPSPTRARRLYQLSSRQTDTCAVSSSQTLNGTSTDVISTDTAGTVPTSKDNANYLQLLQDRATRYLLTIPLSTKADATISIQRAISSLHIRTGRPVRRYHADNAREQHAEPLQSYLLSQGTEMITTTPHTSQQNPQAQRAKEPSSTRHAALFTGQA